MNSQGRSGPLGTICGRYAGYLRVILLVFYLLGILCRLERVGWRYGIWVFLQLYGQFGCPETMWYLMTVSGTVIISFELVKTRVAWWAKTKWREEKTAFDDIFRFPQSVGVYQ